MKKGKDGSISASRILAAFLAMVVGCALAAGDAEAGRPYRGAIPWSVLLCKFKNGGTSPRDAKFFEDMFFRRGTQGLADVWGDLSEGSLTLDGTAVKGWYDLPYTLAEAQKKQADLLAKKENYRWFMVEDCTNAAKAKGYTVPAGNLTAIITHPDIDLFGWTGGAFFGAAGVEVGALQHECGHGLGLNHSFSDHPTFNDAGGGIGEYDDLWDAMSYANVFTVPTTKLGNGGPGLNAYHVDRIGWMSRLRAFTVGADGNKSTKLTLGALNHPESSGYLQVRVPFDANDPFHYYTVEFRRKDGWDGGFPADTILIHEVKKRIGAKGEDLGYHSYLLREPGDPKKGDARNPVQSLNKNGVSIRVDSVSAATNQATISVTTNVVDYCVAGYVWREANASDRVCVTPAERTATKNDNGQAAARKAAGGAYGPDTCKPGFVWRETSASDHVCVTPETRARVVSDNKKAAARRNVATVVYGPNTCKSGFVWREADDRDWVCVKPQTRAAVKEQNRQAPANRTPGQGAYGPDTCIQGYVWREANGSDHACVKPNIRTQTQNDNKLAASRKAGGASGPDTCKAGFVWREAFGAGDHVCTTPDVREQARYDNAEAPFRKAGGGGASGSDTCKAGLVWRDAFPGDHVCVTTKVRSDTQADNREATNRLMKP